MGSVHLSRRKNMLAFYLSLLVFIFVIGFLLFPPSAKKSIPSIPSTSSSNIFFNENSLFRKNHKKFDEKRTPPSIVRYQMNNVTTSSDPVRNRETVLILTVMAQFYQEYWDNLMRLNYPRELITLGFIIPKDQQGNIGMKALLEQIKKFQNSGSIKDKFQSIVIERQDFDISLVSLSESDKYNFESQKSRRVAISRARNSLLFTTLNPAISWVLWLDSDITETPPTLIQDLASHNKPVIVPNCYQKYRDPTTKELVEKPYDFNSWQENEKSRKITEKYRQDEVILEGFTEASTHRSLMAFMATKNGDPKFEVKLDGVGGNVLLVKAEVHRDGAMFPPFVFYHLIESEGFAKMAKRLGWNATGLPNYKVKVYHPPSSRQETNLYPGISPFGVKDL
ncbi:Mannan polymerase complexes subunit MNN9 [Golovinomyces cichoracearum]|uniref:Mannan polymerase complexes subunit MNN9 n=1 Tax=Golovinomyces cichoracearum TaxID=62708 RepID=A0A420IE25_9PEZI|nr:Mannan polymerase complexes subunit MNN9 [Golovinomyces cichoracearum]